MWTFDRIQVLVYLWLLITFCVYARLALCLQETHQWRSNPKKLKTPNKVRSWRARYGIYTFFNLNKWCIVKYGSLTYVSSFSQNTSMHFAQCTNDNVSLKSDIWHQFYFTLNASICGFTSFDEMSCVLFYFILC